MTVRPTPYVRTLPLGKDPGHCRQRIEALEHLLESAFPIPGTKQRVGLDVLQAVCLVPSSWEDVEGDLAANGVAI